MDVAILIPYENNRSKEIEYVLKRIKETNYLTLHDPINDKEKNTVSVGVGITDSNSMRLAGDVQMKRKTINGEWKIFTTQTAVEFPSTYYSGERIRLIQHVLDSLQANASLDAPDVFLQDDAIIHKAIKLGLIRRVLPLHNATEKAILMNTWVKSKQKQPLDMIRVYFGDQVGFYFTFLGYYTKSLLFPSIFGLLVHVYQCSNGTDNFITAAYALSITIWATAFLEFWKREESEYGWRWGLLDLRDIEHERPDFQGERQYDEIEEKYVTKFSNLQQSKRFAVTVPILLIALVSVILVTFFFFRLEAWAGDMITVENGWTGFWEYLAMIPTILYSIAVLVMDTYYLELAVMLNKYENHRTDTEYANALVIKLASFYFVNNFGLLFYIAFFVQDFDLLQQTLSSLLITRQLIGNVRESVIPYFLAKRSLKSTKQQDLLDITLPEFDGTFDDYLELFVQFGQVTLFAAAYPLAAMCSLANNIIEIRSDAFKLCTAHQRPTPVQCKGIGTWLHAFELLGYVAVLTNCTLIGLNSGQFEKFIPGITPAVTVILIVGAEHIMIMLKLLVEALVPDVPSHIIDAQKRDRMRLQKVRRKLPTNEIIERGRLIEFGSTPLSTLSEKEDELSTIEYSASPQKWMAWVKEEQQRREQLEVEVSRLNGLYMQCIEKKKNERKATEKTTIGLRQSPREKTEMD